MAVDLDDRGRARRRDSPGPSSAASFLTSSLGGHSVPRVRPAPRRRRRGRSSRGRSLASASSPRSSPSPLLSFVYSDDPRSLIRCAPPGVADRRIRSRLLLPARSTTRSSAARRPAGGRAPRPPRGRRSGSTGERRYLDGRPGPRRRPVSRFLAFGLVVVVGVGRARGRLFYMQVVARRPYAALARRNRTVLEAIPSPRGLIYDRRAAARHQRPDLRGQDPARPTCPISDATRSCDARGAARHRPGRDQRDDRREPRLALRPRPDRRRTSAGRTRLLIAEAGTELPGVEVVVEPRREVRRRARCSPTSSATRARSAPRSSPNLRAGLPARRPDRQGRRRGDLRDRAARHVRRCRPSSATRPAATSRSSARSARPSRATRCG